MRKNISQKIRRQVYEKYGGHCAYCGCELEYKDMQVDHVSSVYWNNGGNEIDNLMPACRMCNFYKSTFTLEKFRQQLQTMTERLDRDFTYRLAKQYGIVVERNEPVKFYFEECECHFTNLDNMK